MNRKATKDVFDKLEDNLHRLEQIITDDIKDMFNSKDSFIFLTLFDKFTTLGLEDRKFAQFLAEFKDNLRNKKRNAEGMLFDEIDKDKSTKDKVVIAAKLDLLETLMREFLHINDTNIENEGFFLSEYVGIDKESISTDIELYNETLDDLTTRTIRDDSKLLDRQNRISLLAMVAYSYKEDKDLDDWLTEYAKNNNMYLTDQKRNYFRMKSDFERFCDDKSRISA